MHLLLLPIVQPLPGIPPIMTFSLPQICLCMLQSYQAVPNGLWNRKCRNSISTGNVEINFRRKVPQSGVLTGLWKSMDGNSRNPVTIVHELYHRTRQRNESTSSWNRLFVGCCPPMIILLSSFIVSFTLCRVVIMIIVKNREVNSEDTPKIPLFSHGV